MNTQNLIVAIVKGFLTAVVIDLGALVASKQGIDKFDWKVALPRWIIGVAGAIVNELPRVGAVVALLVALVASAWADWSARYYFDIRSRESYTVGSRTFAKIDEPLHVKSLSLDLDAFFGAGTRNGEAIAGFSVGKSFYVAKNVDAFAGIGASVAGSKPVGGGFILGLTVRFNP